VDAAGATFSDGALPPFAILITHEEAEQTMADFVGGAREEQRWAQFQSRFHVRSFWRFSRPITDDALDAFV